MNELYSRLDVDPNPIQRAALKSDRFDTAIGLLEDSYRGGRAAVRRELAAILTPTDTSIKVTATHEALLTLGKCRNGKLRIVTTNFDCLFQAVIDRWGLALDTFQAPLLPVPKNRWDGLIYLHGRLPPDLRASDLAWTGTSITTNICTPHFGVGQKPTVTVCAERSRSSKRKRWAIH